MNVCAVEYYSSGKISYSCSDVDGTAQTSGLISVVSSTRVRLVGPGARRPDCMRTDSHTSVACCGSLSWFDGLRKFHDAHICTTTGIIEPSRPMCHMHDEDTIKSTKRCCTIAMILHVHGCYSNTNTQHARINVGRAIYRTPGRLCPITKRPSTSKANYDQSNDATHPPSCPSSCSARRRPCRRCYCSA